MKRRVVLLLAGLLLVLGTALVWQFRFVAVPGAVPPNGIDDPPLGWTATNENRPVVTAEDTLILRRVGNEPKPAVNFWLGPLEGVRFLHIHGEGRWQGVEEGDLPYMRARFVVLMKDGGGQQMHPPDSGLFLGQGDSDWVTVDAVFELSGEMVETGLQLAMLGSRGELEVRDLTVTAVRQRRWVVPATVVLVLGWTAWVACLLGRGGPSGRLVATAALVVAFSWFAVFPQSKRLLRPLVGNFPVERQADRRPEPPPAPRTPPVADTVPKPAPEEAVTETPSVAPGAGAPAPSQPAPPPEAPREERGSDLLRRTLGEVDRGSPVFHLFVFAGFALAVAATRGSAAPWPVLLGVAALSEFVPSQLGWNFDLADLLDLLENFAGVGIGLLAWGLGRRLLGRRRSALSSRPRSAGGRCR